MPRTKLFCSNILPVFTLHFIEKNRENNDTFKKINTGAYSRAVVQEVVVVQTVEPVVKDVEVVQTVEPLVPEVEVMQTVEPVVQVVVVVQTVEPAVKEVEVVQTVEPVVKEVEVVQTVQPVVPEVVGSVLFSRTYINLLTEPLKMGEFY